MLFLYRFLLIFLLFFALSIIAFKVKADYCADIREANSYNSAIWDTTCGEKPNESEFIKQAKADCALTTQKIADRKGASWNSEHNWMYEDQCERFARGLPE
jgi:hypothetical protein